jgi:hypothetical protein
MRLPPTLTRQPADNTAIGALNVPLMVMSVRPSLTTEVAISASKSPPEPTAKLPVTEIVVPMASRLPFTIKLPVATPAAVVTLAPVETVRFGTVRLEETVEAD